MKQGHNAYKDLLIKMHALGDISDAERKKLATHLARCAACAAEEKTLLRRQKLISKAPHIRMNPAIKSSILKQTAGIHRRGEGLRLVLLRAASFFPALATLFLLYSGVMPQHGDSVSDAAPGGNFGITITQEALHKEVVRTETLRRQEPAEPPEERPVPAPASEAAERPEPLGRGALVTPRTRRHAADEPAYFLKQTPADDVYGDPAPESREAEVPAYESAIEDAADDFILEPESVRGYGPDAETAPPEAAAEPEAASVVVLARTNIITVPYFLVRIRMPAWLTNSAAGLRDAVETHLRDSLPDNAELSLYIEATAAPVIPQTSYVWLYVLLAWELLVRMVLLALRGRLPLAGLRHPVVLMLILGSLFPVVLIIRRQTV